MEQPELQGRIEAMAAPADPLRRRLYRLVTAEDQAGARDEAAPAAGASCSAAAFHLDRMEAGLLETDYRRLSGRAGPGAGRASKLYRGASQEMAVSLPPRRYDRAGSVWPPPAPTSSIPCGPRRRPRTLPTPTSSTWTT
jgi:predicted ArsR family transcriptional regulator